MTTHETAAPPPPAVIRRANPYERAARAEKVERLALHCIANGITDELLARCGTVEWRIIAEHAGEREPSAMTRAMVRERVRRVIDQHAQPPFFARRFR